MRRLSRSPVLAPSESAPAPGGDAVTLSRVTKRFPALAWPAVDAVDLSIARGEFFTLIGPSGGGKSTLLRVLAGLLQPDAGTVSVLGQAPAELSRAKQLGWVPQSAALLPWRTVLDNVRLPTQVNRAAGTLSARDPRALLAQLRLAHAEGMLPAQLSGGMRQRVAIARAFSIGPRLLLMDEPFAGLDELTREEVALMLLELWETERPTVVFVTHSVTEAVMLSDRVAVMGHGRLSAVLDIGLPRPRPRGTEEAPRFHQLVAELRARLREGLDAPVA
ncbi:MAG TPA: ABC transporter ATP-binding protein [Acidimicrobiales bacterium]|nr:ABC transporter ATP-binding protein [Acidimicrobiales bacterium]